MKAKLNFGIFLLTVLIFSGCCEFVEPWCIKGEGRKNEEERNVKTFSKIEIQNDANVFLKQGDKQELIVEAQDNILDNLDTYVKSGTLFINYDKCVGHHSGLNVYITLQNIEGLKISGSGEIVSETPIKTENLKLNISGSGKIELQDLDALNIDTDISGSGDIYLTGDSVIINHDIYISGSGNIKAFDIPSENTDINITGSGNCRVHCLNSLHVDIFGSGDVYYKGTPAIKQNIKGSGHLYQND